MRKIRTFMDYLLSDVSYEHQKHNYSTIYGKIIYPVAINPLEYYHCHKSKDYNKIFNNKSKYNIIRGNRYVIQIRPRTRRNIHKNNI